MSQIVPWEPFNWPRRPFFKALSNAQLNQPQNFNDVDKNWSRPSSMVVENKKMRPPALPHPKKVGGYFVTWQLNKLVRFGGNGIAPPPPRCLTLPDLYKLLSLTLCNVPRLFLSLWLISSLHMRLLSIGGTHFLSIIASSFRFRQFAFRFCYLQLRLLPTFRWISSLLLKWKSKLFCLSYEYWKGVFSPQALIHI